MAKKTAEEKAAEKEAKQEAKAAAKEAKREARRAERAAVAEEAASGGAAPGDRTEATPSTPLGSEVVTSGTDAGGNRVAAPGTVQQSGTSPAPVASPRTKTAKAELTSRFLKLSGYKEKDIISSNEERRTFVTVTGGKYQVSPSGKKLRRLSGPPTPRELDAAENPEEEEE